VAAVAATEPAPDIPTSAVASKKNSPTGALLAAALALPGILPATALAQLAPDPGLIELKYLDYRDWQPGADRRSFDLKLDFYRQRSDWRFGGGGSPGIEPFSARWIQTGVSKTF
jgi:hypothetical protein